jgi:hypothetical protein
MKLFLLGSTQSTGAPGFTLLSREIIPYSGKFSMNYGDKPVFPLWLTLPSTLVNP